MTYTAQNFDNLLGLKGFSDQLLQNHFKLYQGYVTNTNKLLETFAAMEKDGKTGTPEYAELKRRFGWEFNGLRLPELYFGNMSKKKTILPEDSELFRLIVKTYGARQACHDDFVNTGKSRGIGWVVLAYDQEADKLFNLWINEHDVGHLAGAIPLLVMDVFEHAFITDYGLDRAAYIDAFVKAIDWDIVQKRFE